MITMVQDDKIFLPESTQRKDSFAVANQRRERDIIVNKVTSHLV